MCLCKGLMDSTGVHIKHSSVLTENSPFRTSSSGESGTAKRPNSNVDRSNSSDEITALDVATSKKARIGATNLSDSKRSVEKPAVMNASAEGENGDIGISVVNKPDISSLDYPSCGSEDDNGSTDDSCIDDIFFKESVRKKLQFLSYMVGMDCSNPVEVLSEVVRVLKELNGGWWCNSHAELK
ncbi:uncharacterized protein LOC116245962 isoform X2 [Nymphaea colorata]|uniref:uncharacterized protein LOC116245962 isoform X2 n=1 Tax=Nymphaea colorata TaxID=210225 RepID=UPI00214EB169|nr:uncharacterized protein LOC116245962 isoform X2 [Nymphaea colorata]